MIENNKLKEVADKLRGKDLFPEQVAKAKEVLSKIEEIDLKSRYIFTDIDGVLYSSWKKQWSKKAIDIYNRICKDFNLLPVISSTWRINHTIPQLQAIFIEQGITVKIHDYTPVLEQEDRGVEIDEWLRNNNWSKYVVIDDSVRTIKPYVQNVVECRGWIGLEEEHYEQIKNIMTK